MTTVPTVTTSALSPLVLLRPLLVGALAVGLAACPSKQADPPTVPEVVAGLNVAKPPPLAEAVASNPLCVGRPAAGPEEVLDIAGHKYTRKGSTVSLEGQDGDDEFILGQITDIKDHTPENAATLKIAVDWLLSEKADAIAVTGDLGETAASIQRSLEDIAAAGLPVLAIVGNRECRDDFDQGVKAAQTKFKNIINMNLVRVLNTDDVSIVSMPGYYNKSYIHCAEGCSYSSADVKELPEIAKMATAPTKILISHGPPRQSGPLAIDRIHEGANVGDPALTEVLTSSALFPFGMFGNILEAGGHATNLSGETRVAPDTWADSLYLNSGPIDSVRWVMLDGSQSIGMAGLIHVKGKQAMYKIKRIKPGEAAVAAPK